MSPQPSLGESPEAVETAKSVSPLKAPLFLLLLLIGIRLAMVAAYPSLSARISEWNWDNNDGYDRIAINWVDTGIYSLARGEPTALRLPLYPALIAGTYRMVGLAYPFLVMILQALLSIWTGLLLFWMTARWFGRRIGSIALLLFIFHPHVNSFIFRCSTETLYLFLLTALVYEAVLFLRSRHLRYLLGAAVAMGLSLLTRQTLAPLAWLSLLALLGWSLMGRKQILRRLAWTLAATATVCLLLAPWLVRNKLQTDGQWVLQTWVGQPLCQGAYVTRHLDAFFAGQKSLTDLDQACLSEIRLLERRFVSSLPVTKSGIAREVAVDQFFRQRARQLAARAPLDRARRTLKNLFWAPVLQMTWRSTRILMWINWPLILFGLWGSLVWIRKGPRPRSEALPVWILLGYLLCAHAVAWPQARYILPGLVPFMAFSAYGLDCLWNRFRQDESPG